MQYLDDAIGDLFNQLEANGLDKTTYIFLMGDNGSALLAGEDGPKTRKVGAAAACNVDTLAAHHPAEQALALTLQPQRQPALQCKCHAAVPLAEYSLCPKIRLYL